MGQAAEVKKQLSLVLVGTAESFAGINGDNGVNRQTGGGSSGAVTVCGHSTCKYTAISGAGSAGTSYSGGSGGGNINIHFDTGKTYSAGDAMPNGGAGGNAYSGRGNTSWMARSAKGGAGNPGGNGKNTESGKQGGTNSSSHSGETGTGGLLIIYSNNIYNFGNIYSNGSSGGRAGGASGGGSVNIFYNKNYNSNGTVTANGGNYGNNGQGGNGSITIGNISTGTFVKNEENN